MKKRQPPEKSTFRRQIDSFRYAFKGIGFMIKTENHFQIHLSVLALVIIAGVLLHLRLIEWIAIVVVSGGVLSAETLNTALEQLTDMVHPEKGEKAARIKDLAAGAVLLCAIAAAIVGVVIFAPKILALL